MLESGHTAGSLCHADSWQGSRNHMSSSFILLSMGGSPIGTRQRWTERKAKCHLL
jgi:hypothetical protein